MTPITVTGFNRDIVIENTASGPPYSSYALEFNPGEGTAFYQSGLPGTTYGLPSTGSFTSAIGDGTVFQFQPYTGSNALVLSSETGLTTSTLTLSSPTTFSRIAIIANSGSASSTSAGTLTLHFIDSSTYVTTYNAQDWFFNPGFALQGVDRINLTSGGTDGGPNGDPRFYQTTVDLWATLGSTNKPLASITFGKANSANSTAIYAVSGLPSSSITAPAVSTAPASNIQARGATLNGQVTATGAETPVLTMYYGNTDGGTTPANWAHNATLGLTAGAFLLNLSSLTPNTNYYFTARAVNSAGTAWATPSRGFSTPQLTLPVVTNLPATSIQSTLATLNGQVLSSGGETPTVTLYYGTSDGGSVAGSWAHNVALGPQAGAFAQTVTGLSPSTAYFFTVSATNSAGTAWATPSQTFNTHATNNPTTAVAVLTQHNDNGRTGMNLNETFLNVTNVNTNQFGLLYTLSVDDQIYAQPLVMTNVNILAHGTHNIVIVATVNDTVYAFDADNPAATSPYWTTSFINPPNIVPPANTDESAVGACGGNYHDFSGYFGIVGAPVIDPVAGTLYLVARTKEYGTNFVQRLHALDITTGQERGNSPVVITATYRGTGDGNTNGVIPFDPLRQNQRPGLLLVNGIVYIAWTSHCDNTPYHGWVIAYDASTLQQLAAFNNTPNGSQAGIWMSNGGPAADTNGNVYVSTGNGDWDGVSNFGESFLKLTRSSTNINVTSWFTPYNWSSLNGGDLDLGSGGVLLIPGTNLLFSGGKGGVAYLVNRDNMGGISGSTADTNIVQSFTVTTDEIHGGAVWWDGPGASYGYIWPASVHLQQYIFNRGLGKFNLPLFSQGPTAAPTGQPGGILALSANDTNAGSGIVWAAHQLNGDANQQVLPGILHAYNAQNVTNELWNSEQMSARDRVGNFAKFVSPTVANGKVYLATFSSRLNVYGLLPTTNALLAVSPSSLNFGAVAVGNNAQASFVVTNQGGAALTNGVATISAGPFSIVSGTPFNLPAFGATNLVVRFAPGSAGSFNNTVTLTSGNGGSSTNTVTGTGAVVPVASFTGSPTSGPWPLTVSFVDNSTGTITNSFWDFGDGITTNTSPGNLPHTYASVGTNNVRLTVTGPVGSNTLTRAGYVIVTNPAPVTITLQRAGNQVQLTWTDGILQSATVVTGPYTNLTGAASPYTLAPSEVVRFFRVKVR
jgi:hypothetical protein